MTSQNIRKNTHCMMYLTKKDEMSSKVIKEFVGLRAKMYSFKTDDEHVTKKANGIKKSVVEREIKFNDYRKSLFGTTKEKMQQTTSFNTIRSYQHELYSITQNKIGLCSFDDKRYILDDNISTYAYGHHKIN